MLSSLLLALIRLYQVTLSRLLGPVCRFEPSCSRYAAGCITAHGAWRGSLLSMIRLCKCHPFHPGGYDPPPPLQTPPQNLDRRDSSLRTQLLKRIFRERAATKEA